MSTYTRSLLISGADATGWLSLQIDTRANKGMPAAQSILDPCARLKQLNYGTHVMVNHSRSLPAEFDLCKPASMPTGTILFSAGDKCRLFVFVISGRIRVDLASESGGSLLLYRINPDDTCVLTTSCLLSGDAYCAEATVEEDVTLLTMPADQFFSSMETSQVFRSFVFSSFSQRLSSLMAKLDEVAFRSIDCRLAASLLLHAKDGITVNTTHDQLAAEIGTAREVISRKLSQWDAADIIKKRRGEILLLAVGRLKSMADDR